MKNILPIFLLVGFVFLAGCHQVSEVSDRPLVGITCVFKADQKGDVHSRIAVPYAYILAVTEAGGVPVVLPTTADAQVIRRYVDLVDGLVLIGGKDIPPGVYGQQRHQTVVEMPEQRYEFERVLIPMWLKTGKPTLGTCLGMQFANVVLGGTLVQDIPSQVEQPVKHRGGQAHHQVEIVEGSVLDEYLNDETAMVYSSHHQAVDRLGQNLRVTAHSPDGVIEAMERTDGPFGLFVQWHPELMTDHEHRRAIYAALIEACRQN